MIELTIERLTFGGSGIGRYEGRAIFVPLSAPGDKLRCRIVRDKGRWAEAEIVAIIEPSPERIAPPCPFFSACGGCQWQFLPYEQQSTEKESIYRDLMQRQAGISADLLAPIAAASAPYAYRSRAQFKCSCHRDSGFSLGFFRRGSHVVQSITHCPLLPEAVNRLIDPLQSALAGSPAASAVMQIDVGIDDHGSLRVVVHVGPGGEEAVATTLLPVAKKFDFALFVQQGYKGRMVHLCGEEDLLIHCDSPPLELAYKAGGFSQINLEQNRRLVETLLNVVELQGRERILDLYCGMGNFSLPLARRSAEVVGIEEYAPSIEQARLNARRNGLKNLTFHARPAVGALRSFARSQPFDLVLLDPPREGAKDLCPELIEFRPPRLVYISCDPATQARDLKTLLQSGYHTIFAQPFDFFPQTHHIESLVILARN